MATKNTSITVVSGNVGKIKEMRLTNNAAKPVNSFSVAVNDTYTTNGQQVSTTVWIEVTVFGRLAEVCSQYLTKGKGVIVTGRLTPQRTYQKTDGTTGYSGYEMIADAVQFLGDAAANTQANPAETPAEVPAGIAWEGSVN